MSTIPRAEEPFWFGDVLRTRWWIFDITPHQREALRSSLQPSWVFMRGLRVSWSQGLPSWCHSSHVHLSCIVSPDMWSKNMHGNRAQPCHLHSKSNRDSSCQSRTRSHLSIRFQVRWRMNSTIATRCLGFVRSWDVWWGICSRWHALAAFLEVSTLLDNNQAHSSP